MLILRHLPFLILICIANFCPAQEYQLTGEIDTALNGKYITLSNQYTEYSGLEKHIADSVLIQNGRFLFTGSLNNPATLVTLLIKQPPKRNMIISQFFLENKNISLKVIKSLRTKQYDSCQFVHADIQGQQEAYTAALAAHRNKINDLFRRETKEYESATRAEKAAMDNDMQLLQKEEKQLTTNFLLLHPNYYISFFWFAYSVAPGLIKNNPDSALHLLQYLTPKLRQLPEAKAIQERISTRITLLSNRVLPDFSIPDVSGHIISYTDYKNKYLLIDFWASWCGPCIADIPNVKKAYASFAGKNLAIISISLDDDKKRWSEAVKKLSLPWSQVSELKGWNSPLAQKLEIKYIPQYYLVDPQGKIVLPGVDIEQVINYMEHVK